jgi:hypothetical protein
MKRIGIMTLALWVASIATRVGLAQVPAGEVAQQVPVVEGVERPDLPKADEAQGNAEAQGPQVRPGAAVQQPQVEMPSRPQQPPPPQY